MRRLALQTPAGERVLLSLYWFFSGYGLRAWRALTALLVVLALTTVLIFFFGFSQKTPTTTITGSTSRAESRRGRSGKRETGPSARGTPGWATRAALLSPVAVLTKRELVQVYH